MSNAAREHQTMEQRLGRLERSLRRWRAGGVCALVLVVATLALGQAPSERVIRASKFALVGPDGRELGALMLAGKDPLLRLTSATEPRSTATLGVGNGTSTLMLESTNAYFVQLGSQPGSAVVSVGDKIGRPRALMAFLPSGVPVLGLLNAEGEPIWEAE